jgi:hypothetical protein
MNYLLIIIFFLILFLISKNISNPPQPQTQTNTPTPIPSSPTNPIITYYKSGGLAGYVIRLEIYGNHTYKLFDHDKLVKTDEVDVSTDEAIMEILKSYPTLNNIPRDTRNGNDFLYNSINIGGQHFSLNADGSNENYRNLVENNKKLFDSIDRLEFLTNYK